MGNTIKEPPLRVQKKFRDELSYDSDTGLITWRVDKGRARIGAVAGTMNPDGYRHVMIKIDGKIWRYTASRVAWFLHHGSWPTFEVDHRDGVRDNNRISNLRPATSADNNHNTKIMSRNTTGVKGVYPQQWGYAVRIMVNGKRVFGGTFKTVEDAAAVRRALELEHFGEFAVDESRAVNRTALE